MIEIELPDGSIAEFPDGTSDDVIKGVIQKRFKPEVPGPRDNFMGSVDAFGRGVADTLSFGLADEIAAGGDALFNPIFGTGQDGGSLSDRYNSNLTAQRETDAEDSRKRTAARLMGQITGGVTGGVGLAKSGLSATANAIERGANLGRVAATSAGEGAILGGLQGFGSGKGVDGRLQSAAIGGALGGGLGGAAPPVMAGASRLLSPLAAPIASRVFPDNYAQKAIGEGVRRSGQSVDDIVNSLDAARLDGQDMFNVADAMGNSGQRMLSTAARTPHNERQAVIEGLQSRQVGQGDRLSSYLAEGFGAPDTAAQRTGSLTADRAATANTNYTAARQDAGPVNLNGSIDEIDRLLGRDPILGETALSAGPLGPRLRALRDQMQRDGEQLVDFDRVLNIKSDMYQQMQRNPQVANDLKGVYSQLDTALEGASDGYRAANDTFRRQSKTIDAVDTGRNASSGRMRSSDTIPQFQGMTPEQQSAFRAGYVDPLIARVEASSMSPTTNKARSLITPKTGEEFPAFAQPGMGEQLGNRIGREQRMFETANAALGGSKTADNLADAAEMNKFDPGIMSSLMRADVPGALMTGIRSLMNEGSGTPPRVVERIARAMMETDPQLASEILTGSAQRLNGAEQLRARIAASLVGAGSAGTGRLSAP